jgi:RNA polymerase sigma factor (sigma-70 family)
MAARRWLTWWRMDEDDAMQTAMIGLVIAAHRWEPERGYQFSTYAYYWLRHACERYGPKWGAWFHVPAHWIEACVRAQQEYRRRCSSLEGDSRSGLLPRILKVYGLENRQWRCFRASRRIRYLDELDSATRKAVDLSTAVSAERYTSATDLGEELEVLLSCLPSRHSEVLRLMV